MYSKDEIDRRIYFCRSVFGESYCPNWILSCYLEDIEDYVWDEPSGRYTAIINGVERTIYQSYMTLTCNDFKLYYHFLDGIRTEGIPQDEEYYMRECFAMTPKTLFGIWLVKGFK